MNYLKCPSCGNLISNRVIIMKEKYDEIENNLDLTDDEKQQKRTDVINSMKLKRYCCKSRIMTIANLIDVINPCKEKF